MDVSRLIEARIQASLALSHIRYGREPQLDDRGPPLLSDNPVYRAALDELRDAMHKTATESIRASGILQGKRVCAVCLRGDQTEPGMVLQHCGRCKTTYYCGKTCQTYAWNHGHKVRCKEPTE
jgi:hypothetical protein